MSLADNDVFSAAVQCRKAGLHAALVTVIGVGGSAPRSPGARMIVTGEGRLAGTIGGGHLEHRAIALAQGQLRAAAPSRHTLHLQHDLGMCCGGTMEIFVEPLTPPPPLVIFGAGHVGSAVALIAPALDFRVVVVDERPEWADPERLPGCEVVCADPLSWLRQRPGNPEDYFLVLTHDHALDQDLIEALLPRPSAWVGLIASRAKVARFKTRLTAGGLEPDLFGRLHSPVGLDIGAQTPAEIAVSIAAELIATRRKPGGADSP